MDVKKLFEKYTKDGGEFEIRFGSFTKSFVPSISQEQSDRLYNFLNSNKKFYTHTTKNQKIEYFGDTRKITENGNSVFNKKTKSKNQTVDVKEWNFRASLSEEKVVPEIKGSSDFSRERTRHSFVNKKAKIQIDLDYYEDSTTVELECLEGCSYETLSGNITLILQILQDTKKPLSQIEIDDVMKYYKTLTKTRKFIGVQPQTLSAEKFKKNEKYAITKKLDGRRFLLILFKGFVYSISSKFDIKWAGYFYKDSSLDGYIFDTEYYGGFYHIFDVAFKDDGNLKQRLDTIMKILPKIFPMEGENPIVIKPYIMTNSINELYSVFHKETTNLDLKLYDGVILVKQNSNYKDSAPLKWKPVHMNTVDFQIVKKPDLVFELYVTSKNGLELFATTTVDKKDYDTYKDGDIAEFSYKNSSWVPLKFRKDKPSPNYIDVAKDNFNSVLYPFDPETVFSENVALYNLRRFHNYIKRILIDTYKGKSVLDLAIGKGGDLGKYNSSGFSYIEGYDINTDSIKEATYRASNMTNKSNSNITVNLNVKDLTKQEVEPSKTKFDLVVSNFAFHYFYNSLDVYIKSVKNNLKKDGHLLLTFFDNKRVKNMKTKNYEIKTIKNDKISVWMKDSVLNKPEIEYIVDIDNIIKIFKKNGLELEQKTYFEEFYKDWSKNNKLSQEEKDLSFLNVALVFKLKKN